MKKSYERPDIRSEPAFEVLAGGVCTFNDPSTLVTCDPDFGFYVDFDGTPI